MTTHGTSHARDAFAERLAARPLLVDGAMGTLLFSRGVPQRASLTELVLDRPELEALRALVGLTDDRADWAAMGSSGALDPSDPRWQNG